MTHDALKHTLSAFLEGVTSPAAYERWLVRKAMAHVKRCALEGKALTWHLVSKYNNDESKLGRL